MRNFWSMLMVVVAFGMLTSCVSVPTFVKGDSRWVSVELRENMAYEKAWATVTDRLIRQFDLEMLSKEDGYFRTGWLYTWTGNLNESYRVRVIGKFSPDHKTLELKCEAEQKNSGGYWIPGYDTRLLRTLQTDILGSLGRVIN